MDLFPDFLGWNSIVKRDAIEGKRVCLTSKIFMPPRKGGKEEETPFFGLKDFVETLDVIKIIENKQGLNGKNRDPSSEIYGGSHSRPPPTMLLQWVA